MMKFQAKLAFKSVSDSSDISGKIKNTKNLARFPIDHQLQKDARSFWVPNYTALNFVSNPGLMLSMAKI